MSDFIFPVLMGVALGVCGISVIQQPLQFFTLLIIASLWGNWK